ANFQPLWACSDPQVDELTVPVVGDERADWQYSIGSVLATGARVAFGSDWPVSSPDPLQLMHVAVNRTLSERYGRAGTRECEVPLRASEAVSALDALSAFTTGVAYLNHDEDVVGELRVGRRADAAVLDQDVLAIESRRIGETSVDLTLAGGDVVFERA
ncbi:MAG: amidohydrolase family protein, partial [Acidimicrobiales bacterium]